MKNTSNVYGLSGLIAVLGLLALLVGLIVTLLLPSIRLAAWGILLLGIILLATAFIIDFRRVGRALTGRRGVFSTGTTVMASIFIGITLLVNAISIGNYHRFDFTGVAQFTLTSQTKEVLSKLETPVQMLIFSIPGEPIGEYASSLLGEYQNFTDQLSLEHIDPDEKPDIARQYGTTRIPAEFRYPAIVFEGESGRRLVVSPEIQVQAEHSFTSAILEVTGIVQKNIYFLVGHGEADIYSDYNNVREDLLANLFKVRTLNLMADPNIPEDLATLIIAGPQAPLDSDEISIIARYLKSGGRVMILANPDPPEGIEQLISAWGVSIGDGTVIDTSSYVSPNKSTPLVTRNRNTFGLRESYFPGATAIIPQEEVADNINIRPLLWTNEDSWLERDFNPIEEPEFNEGVDLKGPLALGVLIQIVPAEDEAPDELTQLVVIGDSDFAANQHYFNGDNGNLFLTSVSWLTAGAEVVSIERKVLPFRRLVVDQEAVNLIRISSIGLLPLLVLVTGVIIWWRRRQ